MLKSLDIKSLTLFPKVSLTFSAGLNVIVGENGSGKTHLLKAIYSLLSTSAQSGDVEKGSPTKTHLQKAFAEKLINVFRPDNLGRLASRKQGRTRCELLAKFDDSQYDMGLSFATNAERQVSIELLPKRFLETPPVYLPTRELLSLYPGFISMYQNEYVHFEETWYDTSLLLGKPSVRGPRENHVKQLIEPLEKAMGGQIEQDPSGRFFFKPSTGAKIEMPLVAEGLKKLLMLARLIMTGALLDKGLLLWDEPEANLNPKLIKEIASVLVALANQGIQIVIATHSLFLLKEIAILTAEQSVKNRYFALNIQEQYGVSIQQTTSLEDLEPLVMLDEELQQSTRFLNME